MTSHHWTRVATARAMSKFIVAVVCISSALSVGLEVAAHAAPAPPAPWSNYNAGAFVYSWGESIATQSVATPSTLSATWTLGASTKWQTIGLVLTGP